MDREMKGIERVKGAQSKNRDIKRKERLITKIMCHNYEQKLLQEIMTGKCWRAGTFFFTSSRLPIKKGRAQGSFYG